MDIQEHHTYETKCRRCGKLEEWSGPDKAHTNATRFNEYIRDMIDNPRLFDCSTCKKMTVQDVVAY